MSAAGGSAVEELFCNASGFHVIHDVSDCFAQGPQIAGATCECRGPVIAVLDRMAAMDVVVVGNPSGLRASLHLPLKKSVKCGEIGEEHFVEYLVLANASLYLLGKSSALRWQGWYDDIGDLAVGKTGMSERGGDQIDQFVAMQTGTHFASSRGFMRRRGRRCSTRKL